FDRQIRSGRWASLMTREHGYKEFDAISVRSSMGPPNQSLGPTTSNSISRGLAAMPAQERSITIEERALGGDQPQHRHREAMARVAGAIEDNIGHGNTVEVGGTQIERAGRIRIAVRIRDIVVRDRDQVIVATAPKAEVKLSGTALLMGRLRAESLNLVDAELAVRITPDGQVKVSAGHTAKPLA